MPSITKIAGIEASAQATLSRLGIDVTAAYLHSKLGRFFAADPRQAPNPPCNSETGPPGPKCFDLGGRVTTYAPKLTGNIGVQYALPIRENLTLTPRINYAHISNSWASLFQDRTRGDRLVPRNIINAQVTLATEVWSLTGYVTNATDLTYIGAVNNNLRYAGPPRQYGVRLARTF